MDIRAKARVRRASPNASSGCCGVELAEQIG
jgi:hypothetical protein